MLVEIAARMGALRLLARASAGRAGNTSHGAGSWKVGSRFGRLGVGFGGAAAAWWEWQRRLRLDQPGTTPAFADSEPDSEPDEARAIFNEAHYGCGGANINSKFIKVVIIRCNGRMLAQQ